MAVLTLPCDPATLRTGAMIAILVVTSALVVEAGPAAWLETSVFRQARGAAGEVAKATEAPRGAAAKEAQMLVANQRPAGNPVLKNGLDNLKVFVKNTHTKPVFVAIYYLPYGAQPNASLKNNKVEGWWLIQPGKSVHVANTNLPYMTFYAEEKGNASLKLEGYSCFYVTNTGTSVGKRRVCGIYEYLGLPELYTQVTIDIYVRSYVVG